MHWPESVKRFHGAITPDLLSRRFDRVQDIYRPENGILYFNKARS